MDWSRVKSIFIMTFLVLNIFLAYRLVSSNNLSTLSSVRNVRSFFGIESEQLKKAEKILQNRGIIFEGVKLTENYGKYGKLELELQEPDQGKIVKAFNGKKDNFIFTNYGFYYFNSPVTSSLARFENFERSEINQNSIISLIEPIFEKGGIPISDFRSLYVIEEQNDESIAVTYFQKYDNTYIMDNFINVVFYKTINGNYKMYSIRYNGGRVKGYTGDAREIIPIHRILLVNKIINFSTIIEVQLCYKSFSTINENTLRYSLQPCWRIRLKESSEPFYFNAYTGEYQFYPTGPDDTNVPDNPNYSG